MWHGKGSEYKNVYSAPEINWNRCQMSVYSNFCRANISHLCGIRHYGAFHTHENEYFEAAICCQFNFIFKYAHLMSCELCSQFKFSTKLEQVAQCTYYREIGKRHGKPGDPSKEKLSNSSGAHNGCLEIVVYFRFFKIPNKMTFLGRDFFRSENLT